MVKYWLVVGGWGSTPLNNFGSEVVKPLGLAGLAGGIPSEEYELISCSNFPDHQPAKVSFSPAKTGLQQAKLCFSFHPSQANI